MLGVEKVHSLIDDSMKLFGDDHPFPLDPATVLYRSVRKANAERSQTDTSPLSKWIHECIIKPLLQERPLIPDERLFVLSGRAGQGKSTVLRHLFVHLCEQQDGIDPRIRPNFGTHIDADLSQFFKDFQDSAHYIQARELSEHVGFQSDLPQLIFIDGLDEAHDDYKIEAMAQLMIDNPASVFLVSSRSRSNPEIGNLHREEIIHLEKLQSQLQKKNCSVNLLQNSVFLEDLTHKEKKDLLSLIAQVDPTQAGKASTLHTLVENNSSILQRPADFLVYKAKNPKTKSEFFIEHLKWLVEREASKDKERRTLVNNLSFPRAFDLEHRDFVEKGRLVLSPDFDDASIHALRLFNLIESTLVYDYLDLATPAARGLLLLSFSEIQSSAELIENQEVLNLEQMVGSFAKSSLFFSMWKDVISRLHDSPFYDTSVSLLNGYLDNNSFADDQFERHLNGHSQNSAPHQSLIHQAMWMADVAHPVDELMFAYSIGPLHPLLHHAVMAVISNEKIYITCGVCNEELQVKRGGSYVKLHCKCDKRTSHNENLSAQKWFENRLNPLLVLFRRLSFFGPHVSKTKNFTITDLRNPWKIEDLTHRSNKDTCPIREMYQLVYILGILYADELEDSAYSTLANYVNPRNSNIKQNEKSKSRVFLTILYLLSLKEDDYRRHRRTKFDIFIRPILRFAKHFNDWDPSLLIEYDSEDLLYSHWELMGATSQYSNDILTTFIHKGISPNLKYTNWSALEKDRDSFKVDNLARSTKFLNQIERKETSPYLRSIIRAYVLMSRVGHLIPRNQWGFYVSTLGPDIGQIFFHKHDSSSVLDEYNRRQAEIFPIIDTAEISPSFIQHYYRNANSSILKENLNWLHNFLKEQSFPTVNLRNPIFPSELAPIKHQRNRFLEEKSELKFLEYFVSTFGLIHSSQDQIVGTPERTLLEKGLVRLIRSGEFYSSLVMAMRTPETSILSILIECELIEDGFNSPKSSIIGNYSHRRIISKTLHSHDLNNKDLLKHLFMSFIDQMSDSDWQSTLLTTEPNHITKYIFNDLPTGCHVSIQQFQDLEKLREAWGEVEEFFDSKVRRHFRFRSDTFMYKDEFVERNVAWSKLIQNLELVPSPSLDISAYVPENLVRPILSHHELNNFLEHVSPYPGPHLVEIGFRFEDSIHDDPTEKPKNRLRYSIYFHDARRVDGTLLTLTKFKRKYRPDLNKNAWEKWSKSKPVRCRKIENKLMTKQQFKQKYRPDKNKEVWKRWNNAPHSTTFIQNPINHKRIDGEIIRKDKFKKKYRPDTDESIWDIWNAGEEVRNIHGNYISIHEFREIYNPKKVADYEIWNKAQIAYVTHSDYLRQVAPILFCEKYRPIETSTEDSTISGQFFAWLFDGSLNENRNHSHSNFLNAISAQPLTTTYPHSFGDAKALSSWHTMPYFSKKLGHESSLEKVLVKLNLELNVEVQKLFIHHLAEDELILPGTNFQLTWNGKSKAYSFLGGLEVKKHHSKTNRFAFSQGMFTLTRDSTHAANLSPDDLVDDDAEGDLVAADELVDDAEDDLVELSEEYASLDLKTFPSGLRSLSRFNDVFDTEKEFDGHVDDVFLASSRLSSLKHRFVVNPSYEVDGTDKENVNTSILHKDEDLPSNWTSITQPWNRFNNPVYGKKFGIVECEDDEEECLEGFAEWKYLRFSSNKPRKVLTTFVESSDAYLDDPLLASPGWKGLFDEAINLPQQLEAVKANPDESKTGNRMSRVFGIITETGMFDPFKLEQIQHSMNKVRVNLEQLRRGERVKAGRTHLLNLIRDITTSFSYSSWVGNSLEVYKGVKGDVLSLLHDIETAEHNIMGRNLTGTLRDFEVIRAILDGLNAQHDEHERRLRERKEELEKQLQNNEVNIDDFKTTVRKLAKHLGQDMLDEIKGHAVVSFGLVHKNRIETWCMPRRELSVRVLGMPQSSYPFSLTTTWDETLGSLRVDGPLSSKVGSLVRLDLKLNPKAGTLEPLITNIGYAKDELMPDGSLHQDYAFLSEPVSEWPPPLPHDTFFSIQTTNEDVKQRSNFMIPLHVKVERGYATHPNLNVEVPLFEPAQALATHDGGTGVISGALCNCTVDIRRDRRTGLFRYYVVGIDPIVQKA